MIRATITLLLASLFVLIVGSPLLVLAYIHPYPPAADWASRVWSRLILLAAGVRLTVDGAEHVAGPSPKYFVGNHQSAMDIPILITALAGRVRFMAKDNLFRIPLFGGLLTLYDYVPVDRARARRALTSMETMIERVRRHSRSLVVFPEGTR
ncbi:MAG: lysophospholipid acyltransferase family protein, partial [Phycisphaerae bacterium]